MTNHSQRWFYDLDGTIARARGELGDPEPDKARALLRYYCETIQDGCQPDTRVANYLAGAFKEFLDRGENGDLEKSLGLKRRKAGNPGASAKKTKASVRLTEDEREEMREEIAQRLGNGATHASIKKELSPMFGTSQDTVRSEIRHVENTNKTGE